MKCLLAFALIAAMSVPTKANAGPYTDDLSKCLVSSTTDEDKALLTQWMFAVFSLPKQVAKYTSLTAEDRDGINKNVAALFMHLTTETCKSQLHDAYIYEGSTALSSSFEVLGRVASIGLMQDPEVLAGTTAFAKYIDEDKIKAVVGEKSAPTK